MDELMEILRQINELSGVALEALEQAGSGADGGGGAPPEGGEPPAQGEPPVPPGQ